MNWDISKYMRQPVFHTSVAAVMLIVLNAGISFGQQNGANRGTPGKTPPSVIAHDQASLDAAKREYASAVKVRKDIEDTLLAGVQKTGDWPQALKNLTAAQTLLDSAQKNIADQLAKDFKYKAALAAKTKADKDLEVAKAANNPDPAILTPLANKVIEDDKALDKLKIAALDADPQVRKAREKVRSAQAVVEVLKAQFDAGLPDHPEWKLAKAAEDKANWDVYKAQLAVKADHQGGYIDWGTGPPVEGHFGNDIYGDPSRNGGPPPETGNGGK